MERTELTEKSRAILEAVAQGHSYEQVLAHGLAETYHDIFHAASEALDVAKNKRAGKSYDERMEEIRQAHPRAYEKWSEAEEERLHLLFHSGRSTREMARDLQRQPSAVRSRLVRLNLVAPQSAGGSNEMKNGGQPTEISAVHSPPPNDAPWLPEDSSLPQEYGHEGDR